MSPSSHAPNFAPRPPHRRQHRLPPHRLAQDWDAVTVDLQLMGFIPAGVDARASGLVEPLGRIMSSLVSSGGART
eukprot:325949-Chlamydomonas_euryale.AAC.1